jgi:hypothetical protein
MNISLATLSTQTGATGFSIVDRGTNRIIIGRAPASVTSLPVSYQFDGITNPSTANHTFFGRIYTFASNNGSGTSIDAGGITFATANVIGISTEVPPNILFCVAQTIFGLDCTGATGYLVDVGELSRLQPKSGEAQMLLATNARYGLGVTINGTTLQSGNNIIPAMSTSTAQSPGVSQFGINLRSNTNPTVGSDPVGPGVATASLGYNSANQYKFAAGDQVVSSATTTDLKKFTVSFITNINASQPAGVYTTTITFICLANF